MATMDQDLTTTPVDIKDTLSLTVGVTYLVHNDGGIVVKLSKQASSPDSASARKKAFPVYPKKDYRVLMDTSPVWAWVPRSTGHIIVGEDI